ncbi:unnamed protein product [Effrenium voratum]|uniref:Uncharacterized protein n=1 Tax=Effrenium voratum TaxID=2562239 RepID=A0AA36NJR9_9DINO|nr:unnamed protein product [Effrenium voratum]
MWSCCRVEISGQEIIAADTQAYSSPSVASKVAERTPTTSGGDSFGDPSPLSVAEASKRQDFSLAKHESVNGSTITGGCSGSSIDSSLDLEAEQVPVLPEKAPVEEDQIILTSFKARMEKAKDSVEALRAKLQADIIKGRVAQNEAEARELGYYSTSTLMRYLCHTDGDVNKAFKEIKSTVEWRKHNLPPELFVQAL